MFNFISEKYFGKLAKYFLERVEWMDWYKIITITEKYDKFSPNTSTYSSNKENKIDAYKKEENNTHIFDFYYKNCHLQIINHPNKDVVKIDIKKDDVEWCFLKGDASNPQNECLNVYLRYNAVILEEFDDFRCGNERYLSGSWNKYIYNMCNEFRKELNNYEKEKISFDEFNEYYIK